MSTELYSLWLIPPEPEFRFLQTTIKQLAAEYTTPHFVPHLTLLSGCELSESRACSRAAVLADSLRPFRMHLRGVVVGTEYFRSVFVAVEESPPLMGAHEKACQIFGKVEDDFAPHVSLLYGDLERGFKRRLASRLDIAQECRIDRLSVVETSHHLAPEEWRIVGAIRFGKK